jgi:hypothetical protein
MKETPAYLRDQGGECSSCFLGGSMIREGGFRGSRFCGRFVLFKSKQEKGTGKKLDSMEKKV